MIQNNLLNIRVIKKVASAYKRIRCYFLSKNPYIIHIGRRSYCKVIVVNQEVRIKKQYFREGVAIKAFKREVVAREIFKKYSWITPITVDKKKRSFNMEYYSPLRRLDVIGSKLTIDEKEDVAQRCIQILFDIFSNGYTHCDFHSKNIYYVNKQLYIIDFEKMFPIKKSNESKFHKSYDLTGEGEIPEIAQDTKRMFYSAVTESKTSLLEVLGVPLSKALKQIKDTI